MAVIVASSVSDSCRNPDIRKVQWERVSDAALRSDKRFSRSVLVLSACGHRPLPSITEPAGQVWLTWHSSLDSCCDCQHMKNLAVSGFFPPHFLKWHLTHLGQTLLTAQFQGQCLHLPVVVLLGRIQNAKPCFHPHEVHVYSLKNVELLSKTQS